MFTLLNGKRLVEKMNFHPPFSASLFFVYLGRKQNTSIEVKRYMEKFPPAGIIVERISELSRLMVKCKTLAAFNELIEEHEKLVSEHLSMQRTGEKQFNDFFGKVKSLGAWGGDFVMMTCDRDPGYLQRYLLKKGISSFFSFDELVLNED
jgi:hypothetical protein